VAIQAAAAERKTFMDRRYPIGAEIHDDGSVSFRVWAPKCRRVELGYGGPDADVGSFRFRELDAEPGGYYSLSLAEIPVGTLYGFRLDGAEKLLPDPASRSQPRGSAGPSAVVDSRRFAWTDHDWPGITPAGQVLYEMHIGTVTRQGTWRAAAALLPDLADLGITTIEVMPVAEFPGRFGWGYDGVLLFAPYHRYGTPDDFRAFIDRAHQLGLGVILDVVYNHFGNVDNYMGEFSADYYTKKYSNEWAAAINFDGENSRPVRDFFIANARYWIEEFHLDGFRFDATQAIFDDTRPHILAEIGDEARRAAGRRTIWLVAENEPQDVQAVRPVEDDGQGLDSLWNDDFHHAAMVRLTGKNPAYYSDYHGTATELMECAKHGFLYQGQFSQWQEKPRGTPSAGLPATKFISFLQNHDQVANSATGERVDRLTSPGKLRAMTALWLLAPQTPLFFQGQEFAASSPYLYVADYQDEMARLVRDGRANFLSQFPALATDEGRRSLSDPCDPKSHERCIVDFSERDERRAIYDLHRDLLTLRRNDVIFYRQRNDLLDGTSFDAERLALRYFGDAGDDRLLIVNFGPDHFMTPVPHPLVAPPRGRRWEVLWTTEHPRYGATSLPEVVFTEGLRLPAESAIVFRAVIDGAPHP
jgi:maltooligosyltrehalose trehalohydrolase